MYLPAVNDAWLSGTAPPGPENGGDGGGFGTREIVIT